MFLPNWMVKVLGVLLMVFMFLLCLTQYRALKGEPKIMSVTATGKAESVPDLAIVSLGVVAQGDLPATVKNEANSKAQHTIAFIKQRGIADKDIQTSTFYLTPIYDYTNKQNKITGYKATQMLTVKVRNIDKSVAALEKILDGAISNGANDLRGVTFTFDNDQELSKLARKQAIDNAIAKAREIAEDAGLTLGAVVNVVTSSSGNVMPVAYQASAMLARSPTANIELGSQLVAETVTVDFQVR